MAATTTRLDEIREQLAPDQLAFLAERVLCRTDKEAAANLNFGYSTVLSWPEKPIINEAVKLILADGVDVSREILRRSLADAARVKVGGLRGKNKMLQQAAATEILDRFLGKPTQQSNVSVSGGPLEVIIHYADTDINDA